MFEHAEQELDDFVLVSVTSSTPESAMADIESPISGATPTVPAEADLPQLVQQYTGVRAKLAEAVVSFAGAMDDVSQQALCRLVAALDSAWLRAARALGIDVHARCAVVALPLEADLDVAEWGVGAGPPLSEVLALGMQIAARWDDVVLWLLTDPERAAALAAVRTVRRMQCLITRG